MNTKNSINESLEVIRRALEDEKNISDNDLSSNILILNQKVNSDGGVVETLSYLQKKISQFSSLNNHVSRFDSLIIDGLPKIRWKTLLKSSGFCDETKKSPFIGLFYIVCVLVFNRLRPQHPPRFREFLP